MATKIRLKRMGAKKAAFYRLVVADSRSPRDGRNIEEVGYYNPVANPAIIEVDRERINYWLRAGVQMSDTVRGLLTRAGVLEKA
jgi:small subunit ribosomal protein S16